jgi:hypothetical protein
VQRFLYKTSLALNNAKKLELLRTREKIYELHLLGKTQLEISEAAQVSQASVSRSLRAMNEEALKYVFDLAKGDIASQFKECIDGITLAKKRAWTLYDMCYNSDPANNDNKVKLMLSALKVIVQAESERFKLIEQGPSVMTVKAISDKLDELENTFEQQQQEAAESNNR